MENELEKEKPPRSFGTFKLQSLEAYRNTIYVLSSELRMLYFNPGWIRFYEKNNDGIPPTGAKIGDHVLDAMRGPEKHYYEELFLKALNEKVTLEHYYECNTPDLLRIYVQEIHPLDEGEGLLVENHIRLEMEMEEAGRMAQKLLNERYLNADGYYTQCSNCRKTQRAMPSGEWDRVPTLVEKMPPNVSHSICPLCFDRYWDV